MVDGRQAGSEEGREAGREGGREGGIERECYEPRQGGTIYHLCCGVQAVSWYVEGERIVSAAIIVLIW